ncbi:N-formylglutamate amidohydrolase [Phaeovibrio sulfidiphilus]|uniref:N-formylglutamate amidohydrolase n=1 Tax=Phaeovibrio sulfidiphilus TaxID=1220600 RepID=A0A8J6YNU7_9PROT|nr:N-formylglutamate amidohydrolase [Phaeovibrio sulfidiphilus]MBE1236397.1 N-formylglutamate amidohydrolase [Phaeovibrio sulfidiphilus]
MDVDINCSSPFEAPFRLSEPDRQTLPVVVASPHSGTLFPGHFLEQTRLDAETLRRSEDSFVDDLFGDAPSVGVPLLSAVYSRAYLDLNREPYELDPTMFFGDLPRYVNTASPRVAAGLGTIAREVSEGTEIYSEKLTFSDAENRIEALYRPYHQCLVSLIDRTILRFGYCILVDGHSMPTWEEGPTPDIVLGDRHGRSCCPDLTAHIESFLTRAGLSVVRNTPYAGGHTTSFYGAPGQGVHAIQIELARKLYMVESDHTALPSLKALRALMGRLVRSIGELPDTVFLPSKPA